MKKLIEGINYREWQRRNTESFNQLTKVQQKEAKKKGYHNVGWDKVINSWKIICQFTKVVTLFEHKLNKGDVVGAIDQSICEANQAKDLANEVIITLEKNEKILKNLAERALSKYPTL
ncbi:MAG: hypothetical protein EAZ76_07965 [Nostocales cyanobacterium]|nr:MAG: hypothetical protein EAZ87_21285 [Nostocales cyanobacterium]TAF16108.1 MAG: hypothetical protein EAZ76_07965 [Nostocales cyanobacterium]